MEPFTFRFKNLSLYYILIYKVVILNYIRSFAILYYNIFAKLTRPVKKAPINPTKIVIFFKDHSNFLEYIQLARLSLQFSFVTMFLEISSTFLSVFVTICKIISIWLANLITPYFKTGPGF